MNIEQENAALRTAIASAIHEIERTSPQKAAGILNAALGATQEQAPIQSGELAVPQWHTRTDDLSDAGCIAAMKAEINDLRAALAAAPALPAQQQAQTDLSAAIMRLPIDGVKMGASGHVPAYNQGHRDARHAAAELVATSGAAQEQAVSLSEPKIREIAATAALAVAKNASVAEQLCFPHIYLTLRAMLAAAPTPPAATPAPMTDRQIDRFFHDAGVDAQYLPASKKWLTKGSLDFEMLRIATRNIIAAYLAGATPAREGE